MTRILQIRRGTAAENDNFTGMNGEITMDTTNKTVRIHDGETLGGFALARADTVDAAREIESFDITTVPATFWQNLFSTYQNNNIHSKSSVLMPVFNNTTFCDDYFSDLTDLPLYARAFLVCQSDDAGYSTGDETEAFGIGDYASPNIYCYISGGVLHARLFCGSQTFWIPHKTTGEKTNITTSSWKVKITVYY
jgi:hypothetical protein